MKKYSIRMSLIKEVCRCAAVELTLTYLDRKCLEVAQAYARLTCSECCLVVLFVNSCNDICNVLTDFNGVLCFFLQTTCAV